MAVNTLVFEEPALPGGLPVVLVFGDDVAPEPPADSTVSLVAKVTRLRGTVTVNYDSRTPRPAVARVTAAWQDGQRLRPSLSSSWDDATPTRVSTQSHWQDAEPLRSSLAGAWSDAIRSVRPLVATGFEDAQRMRTWPLRQGWQEAVRLRAHVDARYQEAISARAWGVASGFQQALRDRRALVAAVSQIARHVGGGFTERESDALTMRRVFHALYQDARRPPIGRWVRPVVPPQPDPCYLPTLPVVLVFEDAAPIGMPLVFVCERHTTPPEPGTVVVPRRRVYMVTNSITLHRVDTGAQLHALEFSMSLDEGSWTWSWQASLHAGAAAFLGRDTSGTPAVLAVTINGVDFRLRLESRSKDERFLPELRFKVSGRGLAAILDEPYAPAMNFGNVANRTAQQLAADVLTINGVPMGWDLDWGLTDWMVPGGAWTFQGTYVSALNDIATAAGGYVQPHNTDATLRVLPRYPFAPWEWASVTPDFVIPRTAAEVVSTEYVDKPVYNQVHVGGLAVGVFGPWKRAGTAGDLEAPQVTHALITHADAQRQRARAVLGDTGSQAHISLSMQVLPETGVIVPGQFIRYQGDEEVIGIVRGVSLNWNRPTLRQVIKVETHE